LWRKRQEPPSNNTQHVPAKIVSFDKKRLVMQIHIPDQILGQPGYGVGPFLLDVAVMLYQQERVSLAKAARMAGVPRMEFQGVLAAREIPIRYDLRGTWRR